jgi:ribosomal-protein-alanine N-acetyltransferase
MSADEIFAAVPTLSTPRLTLRQIRTEDAAAVFGLFGDAEVTRYYDLDTFTDPLQAKN